jgi:hypothetical protein
MMSYDGRLGWVREIENGLHGRVIYFRLGGRRSKVDVIIRHVILRSS